MTWNGQGHIWSMRSHKKCKEINPFTLALLSPKMIKKISNCKPNLEDTDETSQWRLHLSWPMLQYKKNLCGYMFDGQNMTIIYIWILCNYLLSDIIFPMKNSYIKLGHYDSVNGFWPVHCELMTNTKAELFTKNLQWHIFKTHIFSRNHSLKYHLQHTDHFVQVSVCSAMHCSSVSTDNKSNPFVACPTNIFLWISEFDSSSHC